MQNPAGRRRRENREPQQANLILQVAGEVRRQIGGKDDDAAGFMETFCERHQALGIQAILEPLQIF